MSRPSQVAGGDAVVSLPVVTAFGGVAWEAELIAALDAWPGVELTRRCVDVVELLAVAATGQARAALLSADLRRLDVDAIDRLLVAEVTPVGVITRGDAGAEQRLNVIGVRHVVPYDADPQVIVGVVSAAIADRGQRAPGRDFGDPVAATHSVVPPTGTATPVAAPARRGSIIGVWGPTGAPGRTTVAVALADELSRLGRSALLVDGDVYGGVVAPILGLLDESPGLSAACRTAGTARLDASTLAGLSWQLGPQLRVLTGIPRAERWPELRPGGIDAVLGAARELAEFTVLDCGFAIETDEELSFDSLAPRRNAATLALLGGADVVVVVGAADPIGLQRLVRALADLRDAEIEVPLWVVLNKVRAEVVPGRPQSELAAALQRFSGRTPAAFLPFDQASLDAALSLGRTLAEARPNSRLRRALTDLATGLAGESTAAAPRRSLRVRHRA